MCLEDGGEFSPEYGSPSSYSLKRFTSMLSERRFPADLPSMRLPSSLFIILTLALILNACSPVPGGDPGGQEQAEPPAAGEAPTPEVTPTPPFPSRPIYGPGELVDYMAQSGDTLETLAIRFNTTIEEIRAANTFIPDGTTTMPPGMPMKIPIYYLPLWGSPFQILPDSLFVNGPAQVGFDTQAFVDSHPGWLKSYSSYVSDANHSGAEIVNLIALRYSLSPRLLLTLLEYQSGALSNPDPDPEAQDFPLGNRAYDRKGLYLQLGWAANLLNNGYYQFRSGELLEMEFRDGRLERFDPWQNAASVSLMNFFNGLLPYEQFREATSEEGFYALYTELFGDPWQNMEPHIPGSLAQPEFLLPFEPGYVWANTGGPHTGWGVGEPLAAIDFAPPTRRSGCEPSAMFATAVADGVVARSETGIVVLDLDGDGDERTGWNIFYLHVGTEDRAPVGTQLKAGDPIGHPSCEGGTSTGTHVHIARKYNGEWLPAAGIRGILAFNMEGWVVFEGSRAYQGSLRRFSQVVTACECSNAASFIQTDRLPSQVSSTD